jgi:hypothetical protein
MQQDAESSAELTVFLAAPGASALPRQLARGLAQERAAGAGISVEDSLVGRLPGALSGFFADASLRARAFAADKNQPVGRLVVLLPGRDAYLPQIWRQLAQRRQMTAFSELAEALSDERRGWHEVVCEVIGALAPRETLILTRDPCAAEVLDALMPVEGDAPRLSKLLAALPAPQPATLIPDTGLAMLQRLYRQGVSLSPRQSARLAAHHARQPQPDPIAAFTPEQAARLRARDAQDLQKLAALPGVTVEQHAPYAMVIAAE